MAGIDHESKLKALGLSEGIVALATNASSVHAVFGYRCDEPPDCEGLLEDGLVPLWAAETTNVTACRRNGDALEFVDVDLELPKGQAGTKIARSEAGLLFHLFSDLIEDQDWEDESQSLLLLTEAAGRVGFDRLEEILAFQEQNGRSVGYYDQLRARCWEITA